MRMRDLEQRTGIGRKTIRFYIREGLLPEPEKASPNSARYDEKHVIRLKAIRRLQEERFLPLAVIKALLASADDQATTDLHAFPHLLDHLLTTVKTDLASGPRSLEDVAVQTGWSVTDLDDFARVGLIEIGRAADGDRTLDPLNFNLAQRLADMRAAGFTSERGFLAEMGRVYVEFASWLAAREVELFHQCLAGRVGEREATDLATRGLSLMNDVLGLLRTRAILAALVAPDAPRKVTGVRVVWLQSLMDYVERFAAGGEESS